MQHITEYSRVEELTSSTMADSPDLRRTVLITGCSEGGIGHSLCIALHKRNWRVFATARSPSTLTQLHSVDIETFSLEVNDPASIQACLSSIESLVGTHGLDMLINNAGVNYTVPALDIDVSEAKRVFDTNVFAVMAMVQAFAPLLIQSRGTIVQIGSVAGLMPYVFGSVYNASKAALLSYSNTLRVEMAPLGVKVITAVTGGVKSRLTQRVKRLLPEDSYYSQLDEAYQRRQAHSNTVGMRTDDYAESIVAQILPGSGPWPWRWLYTDARKKWIWEGTGRGRVYWLTGGWLWGGLFDWYFTKIFGLNRISEKAKGA